MSSYIREPVVAGLFYPNTAQKLKEDISVLLQHIPIQSITGDLLALVVPHSRYAYSGGIAAQAYQLLKFASYDSFIVLGTNHERLGFPGTSVYAKGTFKTPLGLMEVDAELAEDILVRDSGAVFDPAAHLVEHSIEVQVPFLQFILPHSKIVPIVMADYSWKACERLADAIVRAIRKARDRKVFIIVSTDLSQDHTYDEAVRMDKIAIQDIESMDPGRLHMDVACQTRTELCGFGPVITAMIAARKRGATSVKTFAYANSGDVTGDKTRVVGYASMAIYRRLNEDQELLEEIEEEFFLEKEKLSSLI